MPGASLSTLAVMIAGPTTTKKAMRGSRRRRRRSLITIPLRGSGGEGLGESLLPARGQHRVNGVVHGDDAEQVLLSLPQTSPYHGEAARLLERAKAGGQYARALALYNQGDGEGALQVLSSQDTDAARALRRQVELVVALRKAATDEQQQMNLVLAQQHWQSLVQVETDPENYYRREALRELDSMKERQQELARQLAEHAARLYKEQHYEKARQLYEQAAAMDPEGRAGTVALEQMREQGRMDYRRALNLRSKDPKKALELLRRACRLLPPEDKYYTWAADRRRELEQTLQPR